MNRDLEEQLKEMGPEYRAVVDRLLDTQAERQTLVGWFCGWRGLVAASLVLMIVMFIVFGGHRSSGKVYTVRVTDARSAYTIAYATGNGPIRTLIETQKADGSWDNDFQTQQNAAALRGKSGAMIAYKKALRYLRSKGLEPLSDNELKQRMDAARL